MKNKKKTNLNGKPINIRITAKQREQYDTMGNFQLLVRDLLDVASTYDINYTIDKDLTLEIFFNESNLKKINNELNRNISLINQYKEEIESLELENKELEKTKHELVTKNEKLNKINAEKQADLKLCFDKSLELIQTDNFNELLINEIIENSTYFNKNGRTIVEYLKKQFKSLDIPESERTNYLTILNNVYR